jgi:hypothetical protein
MKVEILYFDGCPTYKATEKTLREVIAEEGMNAEIKLVALNTDEEAQRVRFPGSPTIRGEGEDLFPIPDRAVYALGCRMYAPSEGLRGSPTAEMLSEALRNFGECDTCEVHSMRLPRTPVNRGKGHKEGPN